MSTDVVRSRAASTVLTPTVRQLARMEAKRYARHPLFLAGFVLAALAGAGQNGPTELDYHVIPSFFIGVLGVIVAARLTTATDRSYSIVGPAPVSQTTRTAAMCLACLVPTAAGVVLVVLHRLFLLGDPVPEFFYGTYGTVDRIVITMVIPVIACAGGPLLGVAVGRWLRFPGAPLLAVIVLLFWSNVVAYVPEQSMDAASLLARILHMAGPYTAFGQGNGDGETATTVLQSFTGSPFWFAVWSLALCGLAVTAALWRGADGAGRRTIGRAMAAIAAVAVVALTLSIANGNQSLFETNTSGTTTPVAAERSGG